MVRRLIGGLVCVVLLAAAFVGGAMAGGWPVPVISGEDSGSRPGKAGRPRICSAEQVRDSAHIRIKQSRTGRLMIQCSADSRWKIAHDIDQQREIDRWVRGQPPGR